MIEIAQSDHFCGEFALNPRLGPSRNEAEFFDYLETGRRHSRIGSRLE